VENLETIRFVDSDANASGALGIREVARTLADGAGSASVHRTRAVAASSLLVPNERFLRPLETQGAFEPVGSATLDTSTLDGSLAELGVTHVDVLDLDSPGRELAILEGGHEALAGPLFAVEVEVALNPLYSGQPLAGEVDSLLRRFGYELFQFLPRRFRRTAGHDLRVLGRGQPVWAEALYLKKPESALAVFEAAGGLERETAIGKAVAVCLLYGFGDYALDLVDSTPLPVASARRLRRTIIRYDSHIDRSVPARFGREEHGRLLQAIDAWLGDLSPTVAPGRTHVALELDQARRLFRGSGTTDPELAERLRQALDWGITRLRAERREKRSRR
jgi:hypothetical protein